MSRASNASRRVAAVAVSLALLILGVVLRDQLPKPEDLVYQTYDHDRSAPPLGEVEDIRVTTGETLGGVRTNAAWVVVDYAFTPETLGYPSAQIITENGTLYDPLPELPCTKTYPGLRTECTSVFEMPLDSLAGAQLRLDPGSTPMAPRLVVPLENPVATREIVREGFEP
ncbi:hypothetical protein [Corynebacterium glaucum]|uniref:hypothetical protein n=1 Tax=Corynebacterium glaucum TaxID=187491 RepID=UPI0026587363|nr:hypothetical protein [Corynebacterium glaucum]